MSDNEKKPTIGNRMGFIETISDNLTLYRGLLEHNNHDLSFDEQMLMRKAVEDFKIADLYFMHEDFQEILSDYGDQFDGIDYHQMRFSEFTRPCSRICYMRINHQTKLILSDAVQHSKVDGEKSLANYGYVTEYFEDKTTAIYMTAPLAAPRPMGAYHPDHGIYFPENLPEDLHEPYADACFLIAGAFELINNPKFVTSQAAGTRSQRKQMKREQNIPLEAWHQIAWNVDEDTVEVKDGDRGGWRMPLHYTRGHPRKAEPHYENVMYKDGKPYKWIHGFWSGHPAYGIKKGYHAPKITAA